jgi:heterodisulfide reductase subunit A-like polyferredoxin
MIGTKAAIENPMSDPGKTPVGAVVVVGGGVAGMQASLDLAEQGFKVYLIETKSAIGGKMAQLDKTFPTNDCAMCTISPKLVETGRNHNIEIMTNSEVMEVDGEVGNFSVRVRHEPRYIDIDKCVACNDCVDVCPVVVSDTFNEGLSQRRAAYKLYPQAVPNAYAIDKLGIAPCRDGCPAGQRAQGYIALIAQGRYRDALRVIKEDNPFPSVCGRTCHHPCESKCTRKHIDDPVGIMALKRFVVDYALAYGREKVEPTPRTRAEWVAVVGAGPAGLTAAHDLAKLGYGVTVYEALPVPGGMMRVGIPAHRLPKGVLQQDIDDILALGIVLKTNSPIENPVELLNQGYNAVCLATGISTDDHSLGIEGEDVDGVISAATFLRKINLGEPITIGKRVAVVGGGITALDAAAVARRLGAEVVHLVMDRPRGELPAYIWEVDAIEAEGIQILDRTIAIKILSENGEVSGVTLAEAGKGMTKDSRGRRTHKIKPDTEFNIQVDTVIGTVGQLSDLKFLDPQFDDLSADRTLASDIPGLFVVGGRKTGASYIIEAIALGHRVADSIHQFLTDEPPTLDRAPSPPAVKISRQEIANRVVSGEYRKQEKIEPAMLPMEERVTSFREVVLGYTDHQARAEANRCLQCGICSECLECVYACGTDAIDQDMVASEETLKAGAIILAPGYQAYRAELSEEYGLDRYPNVITSLQLERLLSASGPTSGHIRRPSDNEVPKRIAFLQCVGSRDQDHDYCSAVCCMAATKEAIIAKEHHPDLDIQIFMMDMRAFSKGYLDYFERSRERYGVLYTHCRVSMLYEDPQSNDLFLEYLDENGTRARGEFDLVVLSIGMEISASVRSLGNRLGIELDEYGFCHTPQFNPLETSRPGIYAVGPFREPKDIPESVIEASGAASAAASRLATTRFSLTTTPEFPKEKPVGGQDPRIGVFVCHCGSNIAGFLDVSAVAEYAKGLSHVVFTEENLYTCSQDSIQQITEQVKRHDLNRVVVASCTPLTHQPLFQDSIQSAGLNPYLFEMANIRNHCSWVHSDNWSMATSKAKDLVRMAVARAAHLEEQHTLEIPVQQSALVVGGGVAGMTTAISLAEQGFPVHLVEKEAELGGNLRHVFTSIDGKDPRETLNRLIEQTHSNDLINTHLVSQVTSSTGFMGNFNTVIKNADGMSQDILHGATIIATGGREYEGPDYSFGLSPKIVSLQSFEDLIANDSPRTKQLKSVIMIQCVGPAEDYCSRICCSVALKNALKLKEIQPDTSITVLFKDIRTYGFKEQLYSAARALGVLFVRYDEEHLPEVAVEEGESGDVNVSVWDPILRGHVRMQPDMVVLSMPVVPAEEIHKLATMFKLPLDKDGFLLEAHVKLRPVDFSTDGVFMAGMAHYPKLADETIIQAQAAAARAARVISRSTMNVGGRVAVVDESLCTGCLTCVRICPYNIPQIKIDLAGVGNIMGAAYVEPAICRGCGSCVSECPARAIQLMHYTDVQMEAKVNALLKPEGTFIPLDQVSVIDGERTFPIVQSPPGEML